MGIVIRAVLMMVVAGVAPWVACSPAVDESAVGTGSAPSTSEAGGALAVVDVCSVVEEKKLERDLGIQAELEELERNQANAPTSSTAGLDRVMDVVEWSVETAARHALPLYEALTGIVPPEVEPDLQATHLDYRAITEGRPAIPQDEVAAEARQRLVDWINERCHTSYRPGDL